MIRTAGLLLVAAAMAAAQDKGGDPLAALEQAAQKRTSEWDTLAKGLESRIVRLLPCDPRVQSAIDEVSRASGLRIVALQQYFQAAATGAKDQTEAAKRLLAEQEATATEWSIERPEAEQEAAGIEGQIVNLNESARGRTSLADARKTLESIREMTRQRAAQTQRRLDEVAALRTALSGLASAYQTRQAALESELGALSAEGMRWSAYYAARLARAQTECALTNPGAPARPRQGPPPSQQQKKGKQ